MSIKVNLAVRKQKSQNEQLSSQLFPITIIQKAQSKQQKLSKMQAIQIVSSTNPKKKQNKKAQQMNNTSLKYLDSSINQKIIVLQSQDIKKMLDQSEYLLQNNESIKGINLLKALTDDTVKIKDKQLNALISLNLAIAYYQIGFLQESYEEFEILITKLNKLSLLSIEKGNHLQSIQFSSLKARSELQMCILFSQLTKHNYALSHAQKACKLHFQLIYDIFIQLSNNLLSSSENSQNNTNLINNILLLEYLHKLICQLYEMFQLSDKIDQINELLEEIKNKIQNFNKIKINIELFYNQPDFPSRENDFDWMLNSKILDRILMKPFPSDYFENHKVQRRISNQYIIEKITFLAISFYCYSTEIRFIEKIEKQKRISEMQEEGVQNQVMDSQHWLSKSLQIIYSFMPSDAPILNQILTVHDRFHGLDKQTIPEDKQINGNFKVLRPLAKPKSIYNLKSNICQPIIIRIKDKQPKINHFNHEQNDEIISNCNQISIQNLITPYEQKKVKKIKSHSLSNGQFNTTNKIKGLASETGIKILGFEIDEQTNTTEKQQKKSTNIQFKHELASRTTISYSHQHKSPLKKQDIKTEYLNIFPNLINKNDNTIKTNKINNINAQFSTLQKTDDILKKKNFFISDPMKRKLKKVDKNMTTQNYFNQIQTDKRVINIQDSKFRLYSFDKTLINFQLPKQSLQFSNKIKSVEDTKRRKSLPNRNPAKERLQKIYPIKSVKIDGFRLAGKKLEHNFTQNINFLNSFVKTNHTISNEEDIINEPFNKNFKFNGINAVSILPKQEQKINMPEAIRSERAFNDEFQHNIMFNGPMSSRILKPVTQTSRRDKFINKRRLSYVNVKTMSPLKLQITN